MFMAWMEYKKAFDSVSHNWNGKCLNIFLKYQKHSAVMNTSMKFW